MKSIFIILSLFTFNLAQAEPTAEESKVNQTLVTMLSKCTSVDLASLANQYNSKNINAAGTKLVFMQTPNNPFMDSSGPKVEKVVKLSKNGACSLRNANVLDSKLGSNRISYADAWLFQCQKQIVEISSRGMTVSDLSQVSTQRKGDSDIETLMYDVLDESGEVIGQLSSVYEMADFDPMIPDLFPEPVGLGCAVKF